MIKVNQMLDTMNIDDMKKESLLRLSKKKHIKDFFMKNHLSSSMMNDYWVELLDFDQDYEICLHCQSLSSCPKENKGMRKQLGYYDEDIIVELESCLYGKDLENQRLLLERYVVSNIPDQLKLTSLKDSKLLHKQTLTPNEKLALAHIRKFEKNPNGLGLFLHGPMGTGKTVLLAGLMNSLAKSGKDIGFIHFPTYLIDLKSSFSSGNTDNPIERVLNVDYLLLDEIGEENVTAWSRDEILLTILSYRLLNHLPTFIISMYNYKDLKKVYTIKKGDEMRANTLVSKIQSLCVEIMLDGEKIQS